MGWHLVMNSQASDAWSPNNGKRSDHCCPGTADICSKSSALLWFHYIYIYVLNVNYQLYDNKHIISLFETFWYMSCNAAVNRTKQSPVICWYPQQCRLFSRVFTGFPMPSSKTTPSTGPYPECSGVIHEIYRNRNLRHLRRNAACILNLNLLHTAWQEMDSLAGCSELNGGSLQVPLHLMGKPNRLGAACHTSEGFNNPWILSLKRHSLQP